MPIVLRSMLPLGLFLILSGCFGSDEQKHAETTGVAASQGTSSNPSAAAQNPVVSLSLRADALELAEGNTTTLHVGATYADGGKHDVVSGVQWIMTNSFAIEVKSNQLTALHEGVSSLRARYKNLTSGDLGITVYKAINGHRLPPEPDEDLNNETVLGIDTNNNGVRDDVERWIFEEYDHPIVQALAMQNARAFQITLADPSKAKETTKLMENQTDCQSFYTHQDPRKLIQRGKSLYKESRPFILNTRARNRAYYEYNQALSGGIYPGRDRNTHKERCDFNETKVLRGEWE